MDLVRRRGVPEAFRLADNEYSRPCRLVIIPICAAFRAACPHFLPSSDGYVKSAYEAKEHAAKLLKKFGALTA
jgi:hypothetical protein